MPTLSVYDFAAAKLAKVSLDVRFTKRHYGGYYVVRADNGRKLGWVYHNENFDEGKWSSYVSVEAFCGSSLEDTGDLLDHVDEMIVGTLGHAHRTGRDSPRQEAAESLLTHLFRYRATAVTGEASYYCTPWKSRSGR